MLRGYYNAAAGMLTYQRSLNTISENMSNAQTSGYKRDDAIISTFGRSLIETMNKKTAGTAQTVYSDYTHTYFDVGNLEETGRPFDVALAGDGFFNVQPIGAEEDGAEPLLTRAGQFALDSEGYLVMANGGGRILGTDGEIQLGTHSFEVRSNGDIYIISDTVNGRYDEHVATLRISYVADEAQLEKVGQNQFRVIGESSDELPEGTEAPRFLSGFFESSNINMGQEMTQMIETQRAFQTCSKALQMIDLINARSTDLSKVQ